MSELLYTCPVCQIPNFSATGLHRHQCRAKPGRAKLTLVEIASAPVSSPLLSHPSHSSPPSHHAKEGAA